MYKKLKDSVTNEVTEALILNMEKGFIPNDPANKDWQAYQEWLAQGNQPLEADE